MEALPHLQQSGKVKALQPAGPIYQQGPGSGVPFWACCFNNSWIVLFFCFLHSSSLTLHSTILYISHSTAPPSPMHTSLPVRWGRNECFLSTEPRWCHCCYVSFKFYTTLPGCRAANVFISHLLQCLPQRGRCVGLHRLWDSRRAATIGEDARKYWRINGMEQCNSFYF